MRPRLRLRWKILLLTVPPLVTLAVASLWLVERNLSVEADRQLRDDLQRSSALFENMLHARSSALVTAASVVVRDPKFFSVLDLPVSSSDPQYRATVTGVAADFNRIIRSDLFEVTDAHGRLLTSVGEGASDPASRQPLIDRALRGDEAEGLIGRGAARFQAVVVPVVTGGRVVGALLLGAEVGHALATELRDLTRSEVTFLAAGQVAGTTLARPEDRDVAGQAAGGADTGESGTRIRSLKGVGTTWITLVGHIPGSAAGERFFYVMQRSLDLETAVLRQVRDHLVELGLVAIALALFAGLIIAHGLNSPIQRMVRAAEAMERGDYEYPLDVPQGDELGYLASRFDDMRVQQRNVVASLQEAARVRREFISVASHELRTPISVIHGFHELLSSGAMGTLTDAQQHALGAIERSIATLSRIAADATRMSQIEDEALILDVRDCDASEVIHGAVQDAVSMAQGRSVSVETMVVDAPLHFRADRERLRDALANLVRNGIRFTPDGGRVTVRARLQAANVLLEVVDSGVGIPAERLKQLFERHAPVRDSSHHHSSSTLEFNSAGLGLGLAIARGIIEAHGGKLRAESREGHGSTFTIDLPAEGAVALAAAA